MYSCYQTVGTCYPPPGLKKQGQVQDMQIGRKTKVPTHLALKIIVATVLERGLWPQPLLRLSRCCFCFVVRRCFFGVEATGICDMWECSFLTKITSNASAD